MGKYDHLTDKEKRERIEELKKKINQTEAEYNYNKAMQLGLKLVLNGSYGAFCHPAFSVSNTNIANSITSLAREVINYMLDRIEDYFYNIWGNDKESHALLGDVYVTKINDDYYIHRVDGKLIDEFPRQEKDGVSGYIRIMSDYYLTNDDVIDTDKNIIEWEGKEYEVVNKFHIHDFSNVQSLPTAYAIQPDTKSKDFDKSRGVRKVPIIIYGDTDSLYISFTAFATYCGYDGDMLKFIHHMNGCFVKFLFKSMLEDYASGYGVKNIHDFELETINASGLHMEKKMYINNVVWEDGIPYENLSHYYPKGIAIVRSSTPLFVREKIWDFIKYIFKDPDNLNIREILKILKKIKKEFMLADIEDISSTTSLSNYEEKVIDDQNTIETVKGAHFSVKSAALHNYFLNKNSSYKTKYDLLRGNKIKYYMCNHQLGNYFGYLRSFHPTEITSKEGLSVDYDTQFEKTFLSIVNRFLDPIGLPPINKRLSVLNSLFSVKVEKKDKKKDVEKIEEQLNNVDEIEELDDEETLVDFDDFENQLESIKNEYVESDLDDFENQLNDIKTGKTNETELEVIETKKVEKKEDVDDFWD